MDPASRIWYPARARHFLPNNNNNSDDTGDIDGMRQGPTIGADYKDTYATMRNVPAYSSDPMRNRDWVTAAIVLVMGALLFAALGLSIWAVVRASHNAKLIHELDDDDGGGGGMKRSVYRDDPGGHGDKQRSELQDGQTMRWNAKQQRWLPSHGQLAELQDVQLGSKRTPLEDGDILRWQQGRIVNARDRWLEQELGHHLDTRFVDLRTGDIVIRNQTSGQWRNVPIAALLRFSSLADVEMYPNRRKARSQHRPSGTSRLPHATTLQYDGEFDKWVPRGPQTRAWMRFCVAPESNPADTWGRLNPELRSGQWTHVRPISPSVGIYLLDIYSRGGLRVSRKHVSITTPDKNSNWRPTGGITYRIRATISAIHMPMGAWGILVGQEKAPADGGFLTGPSNPNDGEHEDGDPTRAPPQHWNFESVRTIQDHQEIVVAFRASLPSEISSRRHAGGGGNDGNHGWPSNTGGDPDPHEPLIQCFHVSVEEI